MPITVAYTLEQCWHRVPGGTAVSALRTAEALVATQTRSVQLVGVAGRHREAADPPWQPAIPIRSLPVGGPALYESWLRIGQPRVELATGPVDLAHATTIIPCPSRAPLVVTVHDLAWRHDPGQFTRRGVRVFNRSLELVRRRSRLVLCPSVATAVDCERAGIAADKLRVVPWGVDSRRALRAEIDAVRARYVLPEQYLLFVGTAEPRKNLHRLVEAVDRAGDVPPLVIAGATGWGDATPSAGARFIGFVAADELAALYAGAAAFCYPSLREGFGLPVLEAMAQGTPVVTSAGTSMEEVTGDAAVLVDPLDVGSIAAGIVDALTRREALAAAGLDRAAGFTWARTAELTAAAYAEATA